MLRTDECGSLLPLEVPPRCLADNAARHRGGTSRGSREPHSSVLNITGHKPIMRTSFANRRVFPRKCRSRTVESNSDPRSLPSGDDEYRQQRRLTPVEEVTQVSMAPASAREALDMVR